MLNQLSFISILIFLTLGFQSQINVPLVLAETSISSETDIDRAEIIEFAKTYLGTTYQYASVDPTKGFDCSGFVSYVYNHFDIWLPRASKAYKSLGTAQKPEDFKVGDILVFYGYRDKTQIGHVGIICEANGLKSKFIHASSGKAYGVTISQLDSDHYALRFYKCIDVIRQ